MKQMNLDNKQVASEQPALLNPEKLAEVQERTYVEMLNNLMLYGECNIERPTGFGKTKLFMQFASDYPADKILYIYDVNAVVEDITIKYTPTNVEFMSYARLSLKESRDSTIEQLVTGSYMAVIFDESHLMGGDNIKELLQIVLPVLKASGCKIIGGTATPMRTDGCYVTAEFFDGHTVFEYTIFNAFDDGIMLPPVHCLMLGTLKRIQKLREEYKDNKFTQDRLNQLEHAYASRLGAPAIYRKTILETFGGKAPEYMRFIAFYPTIQSAKDNAENLQKDFQKAFPSYGVGLAYVTSDAEHDKTIAHLDEVKVDETIDIIASVNMLNQSYHSPYLTGIIMLRSTFSDILYAQEYGRALSVTARNQTIVFDDVGNALLRASRGIGVLFEDDGTVEKDSTGNGWHWKRKADKHTFSVSAVELSAEQALERIRQTAGVTEELIESIKKLIGPVFNAPDDAIAKMTRVPLWLIQETRKQMQEEQTIRLE